MKVIFINLCFLLAMVSCGSQSKSSSDIPYTIAKNYFVKNTVENKVHELSIFSQDEFDRFFGMARIMGEKGKPTPIDFSTQYVIAVINTVSNNAMGIDCKAFKSNADSVIFQYKIASGETQGFESRHALILIVDKEFKKDIKFVKD